MSSVTTQTTFIVILKDTYDTYMCIVPDNTDSNDSDPKVDFFLKFRISIDILKNELMIQWFLSISPIQKQISLRFHLQATTKSHTRNLKLLKKECFKTFFLIIHDFKSPITE